MIKKPKAAIINFSTNNLLSIDRAIKFFGFETTIISEKQDISSYDLVVLPGVGAYSQAMKKIKETKLLDVIETAIVQDKNLLSICLGMQLLFEESEEFGSTKGIGYFKGKVESFKKFDSEFNTFVGWNRINFINEKFNQETLENENLILNSSYYFVHSFCVQNSSQSEIKGISNNGSTSFISIIKKDNVIATQFHPEKSGKAGIKLLEKLLKPIIS